MWGYYLLLCPQPQRIPAGHEPPNLLDKVHKLLHTREEMLAALHPTAELTDVDQAEVAVIARFHESLCSLVQSMKAMDTLSVFVVCQVREL